MPPPEIQPKKKKRAGDDERAETGAAAAPGPASADAAIPGMDAAKAAKKGKETDISKLIDSIDDGEKEKTRAGAGARLFLLAVVDGVDKLGDVRLLALLRSLRRVHAGDRGVRGGGAGRRGGAGFRAFVVAGALLLLRLDLGRGHVAHRLVLVADLRGTKGKVLEVRFLPHGWRPIAGLCG